MLSCTVCTENCGAAPPSDANASSRMCSMRPAMFCSLATVKSHASVRSLRATPACSRLVKIDSKWPRRASMAGVNVGMASR